MENIEVYKILRKDEIEGFFSIESIKNIYNSLNKNLISDYPFLEGYNIIKVRLHELEENVYEFSFISIHFDKNNNIQELETINSAHKEAISFDSMSEIDSFIKNHNPYRNDQEKENVNKIRENFNYKKLKDPKTKMLLFLGDNLMVFYDVLETIVIGTKGVFNKDNLNFLVKKDNQDINLNLVDKNISDILKK